VFCFGMEMNNRMVCWTPQKIYHHKSLSKHKLLSQGVQKRHLSKKNASKRGEFLIVKKTTCLVLLFENVFYSPLFEAFSFKKVPFLESRLTKTFLMIHVLVGRTSNPNEQSYILFRKKNL